MKRKYLGTLQYADPLYEILFSKACPDVREPIFHVKRISSHSVYQYTEEKSRVGIIGKFFNLSDKKLDRILRKKGEYDNLEKIRSYGFNTFPNYVVRPIGREESIGLSLVEEFILGKDLDYYLKDAIYNSNGSTLKDKLSRLSTFLYALHTKTKKENYVDLDSVGSYFYKIVEKLCSQKVISDDDKKTYLKLMDKWLNRPLLQEVNNVIVHGDATPTNFIFTGRGDVVAIDLERMKDSDLAYDVGMICGEIKHSFMWRTGNPYAAEYFIRYFLKKYSKHFSECKRAFRKITLRNPFYMAMTELRIARNDYLDWNYRKWLVYEAFKCLSWGLKLK
jgi:thiamine kinase-like enzyme